MAIGEVSFRGGARQAHPAGQRKIDTGSSLPGIVRKRHDRAVLCGERINDGGRTFAFPPHKGEHPGIKPLHVHRRGSHVNLHGLMYGAGRNRAAGLTRGQRAASRRLPGGCLSDLDTRPDGQPDASRFRDPGDAIHGDIL